MEVPQRGPGAELGPGAEPRWGLHQKLETYWISSYNGGVGHAPTYPLGCAADNKCWTIRRKIKVFFIKIFGKDYCLLIYAKFV